MPTRVRRAIDPSPAASHRVAAVRGARVRRNSLLRRRIGRRVEQLTREIRVDGANEEAHRKDERHTRQRSARGVGQYARWNAIRLENRRGELRLDLVSVFPQYDDIVSH